MSKAKRFSPKRLRSMSPEQRVQAKLHNEVQSALTKWRNRERTEPPTAADQDCGWQGRGQLAYTDLR